MDTKHQTQDCTLDFSEDAPGDECGAGDFAALVSVLPAIARARLLSVALALSVLTTIGSAELRAMAVDDWFSASATGAAIIGDVIANDIDVRRVELVTPPAHGKIALQEDGRFQYEPQPGYRGRDQFIYRSAGIDSAPAVVSLDTNVK